MRIVFSVDRNIEKGTCARIIQKMLMASQHKEEVSLFRNSQIDCLDNPSSQKTTDQYD